MMKLQRVEEICSQFNNKHILVYGDVILDRYIFGEVERISPEAPVPIVKVMKDESRSGGAGNVAANIDGLGAKGILLGISGDDSFADEFFALKSRDNVVIRSQDNKTLVKTRIIAQRQQVVRVDREDGIRINQELEEKILATLADVKSGGISGIIVSDYAKGSLSERIMTALKELSSGSDIPLIVDPKPRNFNLYHDVSGITPNLKEAEALVGQNIANNQGAAAAIQHINSRLNTRFAVVTRGDQGITAGEREKEVFHLPAFSHEVFDVTGAGDTVVSVLLLSLVCGATLGEAVSLANAAASIVIEKVGTAIVSAEEIVERMKFLLKKK